MQKEEEKEVFFRSRIKVTFLHMEFRIDAQFILEYVDKGNILIVSAKRHLFFLQYLSPRYVVKSYN